MTIKTDADLVEGVMARERLDNHDETISIMESLVTPTLGGPLVYVVYQFKRPAQRIGEIEIPAAEGVRWVVRPPGGGGASGDA